MDDIKIYFSPLHTTMNFIIAIGFWCLIIILLQNPHRTNAIIFVAILLLISNGMYTFIKSFLFLITNKPAILLTNNQFIDNTSGKKLFWSDITKIETYLFQGRTFLAISVTQNSIIYRQTLNPFQNLMLRLNALITKKSLMTNFSFLKGENKEIFKTINTFYYQALGHE
jgi:hypothetical protein